jgi:NAD(P)-dependent dehydrogenase (short-subunit alcohol dehydrogenase family)
MKILIIGGDSEIAGGLKHLFCNEGFSIFTTTRNRDAINVSNFYFDYVDVNSYQNLVSKFNPKELDAVWFFAGIHKGPSFGLNQLLEVDFQEAQEVFIVNALGPARLIELLIKGNILAQGAKLVVMTSRAGSSIERGALKHHRPGGDVIYRASRAMLNNLVKNASFTHQDKDISIILMHPGWVRTKSGGDNADLSIKESALHIFRVFKTINKKRSGIFINYDGSEIGW